METNNTPWKVYSRPIEGKVFKLEFSAISSAECREFLKEFRKTQVNDLLYETHNYFLTTRDL